MTQQPFIYARNCAAIPWTDRTSRSRVYGWQTGSVTLRPVNTVAAFTGTGHYESVKMRLQDVEYSADWWTEVPSTTTADPNNTAKKIPSDYFYNPIKAAKNIDDITQGMGTLNFSTALGRALVDPSMDFQELKMRGAMLSTKEFPSNQGFQLRWRSPVSAGQDRSGLFDFYFGEYMLRVNSNGTAEVYQTADYTNYQLRGGFFWSENSLFDQEHRFIIFPHARNKIEFRYRNIVGLPQVLSQIAGNFLGAGHDSNLLFVRQAKGISYIQNSAVQIPEGSPITQKGKWALALGESGGRTAIQISLLTFYNGVVKEARLIDEPYDIGFTPLSDVKAAVSADLNGGNITTKLESYDRTALPPKKLNDFGLKGCSSEFTAVIKMTGLGDVAASDPTYANFSSTSPEIYGYIVQSNGVIKTSSETPTTVKVRRVSIDTGSAPENQTMTVILDSSRGQLSAYRSRSHIPVRLYDDVTGVTLFEGVAHSIRGSLNPSKNPGTMELSCHGMADALLRTYPLNLNFTQGVDDPESGWKWQDVIRACFLVVGTTVDGKASQILFQDALGNDGSPYNFNLWTEGDAGGASGGKGKTDPSANGQRWRPIHTVKHL